MEGGKNKSLRRFFGWPEDLEFVEKNAFCGILLHEQQVIACCQTHYDYGHTKRPLKLAV